MIASQRFSWAIPHLCGMPKLKRGIRRVAIFRAFFDETGLDPSIDSDLVVGGFLGHVAEWMSVSDAWQVCLDTNPKIEYFSSHEARSQDGQFGRWSKHKTAKKVEALASVISKFRLQGFCATVSHSNFVGRDRKASRKVMGTRIYDWGFLTVTSAVMQHLRRWELQEKVDFVFDQRTELSACIEMFNHMKNLEWLGLMNWAGVCSPGDDRQIVALQMADLIASEFSSLTKTGKPSNAWRIIAGSRPVIHIPCDLPPFVPETLDIQKLAKEVQTASASLLKRIYKDKEQTVQLLIDVENLVKRKAYFDIQIKRHVDKYGK